MSMTPFLEFLSDKPAPGFALLKNARISYTGGEGYRVSGFEEAWWSGSYVELRAMLPRPVLLSTREARELASWKYSEAELQAADFQFDDQPMSLASESSDMELFGESWVIFWVVPPDKEHVINILINTLQQEAKGEISGEQLKETWDTYVNRIFFQHEGEQSLLDLTLLLEEIHTDLVGRINALPEAPAEESWEALNDFSFPDEEEE